MRMRTAIEFPINKTWENRPIRHLKTTVFIRYNIKLNQNNKKLWNKIFVCISDVTPTEGDDEVQWLYSCSGLRRESTVFSVATAFIAYKKPFQWNDILLENLIRERWTNNC